MEAEEYNIELEYAKLLKERFYWVEDPYKEITNYALNKFNTWFAKRYHKHKMQEVLEKEIEKLDHQLKVLGFETSKELEVASDKQRCFKVVLTHLKNKI
jgi:ribosomal protein L15